MRALVLFAGFLLAVDGCNVIDPRPTSAEAAPLDAPREAHLTPVPAPAPRPAPAAPAAPAPPPPPAAAAPEPEPEVEPEPEEPDPYTLYGVAWQLITRVSAAPEPEAAQIGYLRRGAQFRAKPRAGKQGCARGWHEIAGGGFVCDGEGVRIAPTPVSFEPSAAPARRFDDLPYEYVMVSKENTPLYYRIPTIAEERAAEELLEADAPAIDAETSSAAPASAGDATDPSSPLPGAPGDPDALTGAEAAAGDEAGAPIPVPDDMPPLLTETEGTRTVARTEDGRALPEYVSNRLTRGFYLSIDGRVHADGGRRFVRTVRGRFVSAARVWRTPPPTFHGAALNESTHLPVGFMRRTVQAMRWDEAARRLVKARLIPRFAAVRIRDMPRYRGTEYLRVSGDRLVRPEHVVEIDSVEPPAGVGLEEKWIDVNLARQTLTAYVGARPVFVTLVSTGRAGAETPTGSFRIQHKHVSTTMDDATSPDGAYSIEDVPWTMYFRDGIALHTAFWHDRFGEPRSHGCVNLTPADARYLFEWTDPPVPRSWHGSFATRAHPGTRVVVH